MISYVHNFHIVDIHVISSNVGATNDQNNYLCINIFMIDSDMNEYLLGSIKYEVNVTEFIIEFNLVPSQNLHDLQLNMSYIDSLIPNHNGVELRNRNVYQIHRKNGGSVFNFIEQVVRYMINDYNVNLHCTQINNINRVYFLNSVLYGLLSGSIDFFTPYSESNVVLSGCYLAGWYPGYGCYYDDFLCSLRIKSKDQNNYIVKLWDILIDYCSSELVISVYKDDEAGEYYGDLVDEYVYTIEYNHDGQVTFRFERARDGSSKHLFKNWLTSFQTIDIARANLYNGLRSIMARLNKLD